MSFSKFAKQRKVDQENRECKEEWTEKYAFILPQSSTKPMCLICTETVAIIKSGNVKRHYESKHSYFERQYPQNTETVVSIATDGAPSMIGREKGAVQRLKEHHPDLLSYHCIIHQSVLCANLGKEYSDVMETIMKLVNYLRASSALQHRLLRAFLTEDDENMECVAFLVDVTSHLNELNLKLQGQGNTVCDLMSADVVTEDHWERNSHYFLYEMMIKVDI
ncbi:hypothetical protein JOQ06_008824 [Pogonophryne albipinna]|uniref:SPIN-DOC-like zinc-finger domain-containing protein n=1 Tax=Pogonophryne albipinna TaxID=1090488 RepID=A0AAD6BN05_9TELE|nr:hypothetical protein JOQ06_008824 [Pogonophryne albipinna]